ncbi:alginate lyase family protein [Paenibacillus planticolens]|uniref:Uncharacterized protein n=1 Tax=Paenibacillus planticolens TaxID=2654976 RepID=A0ABX2A043_9BACL|nr:alginate lyase family protein [Paenibacillus planticolens]NOV04368.1 hypothetical protein [Paenibacillus planticolens]
MGLLHRFTSKMSGLLVLTLCITLLAPAGWVTPLVKADSANLVLGATIAGGTGVGFSSQGVSNTAAMAIDGSSSTVWQPNSTDRDVAKSPNGAWFIVDLGTAKTYNKAVFQLPLSNGVKNVKIEYSNNTSTWTTAYDAAVVNKGTSTKTETVTFPSVTGRYAKVSFSFSNATPNFQLSELELYLVPTGPTEPAPVPSVFATGGDKSAVVTWENTPQDPKFLDAVATVVTDVNDSSRKMTVAVGTNSTTFTGLTNGQSYTFALQNAASDNSLSKSVFVSVVPGVALYPNTLLYNTNQMITVKNKLSAPGNTDYTDAVNKLRSDADLALTKGPYSVMNKTGLAPSGNKHDYWSVGPYWWPDPTSPTGLPYINRDGQFNPEGYTNKYDKQNFIDLRDAVSTLALAYYFTNDPNYAARAALLIKTWFIDPATSMNPNMNYAQGVPGAEDGRKEGVLESDKLLEIIDAIELISNSPSWTAGDTQSFKNWLFRYTNWLATNQLAQDEKNSLNNHGAWYDIQYVDYLLYLGKKAEAQAYLQNTTIPRIAYQITSNGTMPAELRRTRPFHYFLFDLMPFSMLAILGDKIGVDVWNSSGNIKKAYDFIAPYIVDFSKWPYLETLPQDDESPFAKYLREAAVVFGTDALRSTADIMEKALTPDQPNTNRANLVSPGIEPFGPHKEFVAFGFQGLYTPVQGAIQTNDEILVTVPKDTVLTGLVASFTITGASVKVGSVTQVNGVTPNDFTNPVVYTVVSPGGQTRNYTVKVVKSSSNLPFTMYAVGFNDYRQDPFVEAKLKEDSAYNKNLFDVIAPLPQAASDFEPFTWYKGFYNNGTLVSQAQVFIKDGNSQHTQSMPAAIRLLKDSNFGSSITANVDTTNYANISGSFFARTQDQNTSTGYKLYTEWSVDGGATWNVANTLVRDSSNTTLTDSYNNIPFAFSINDSRADNNRNFLLRFRLDKSSAGYMNFDDLQLFGAPIYDLSQKDLTSFSFQTLSLPVTGIIKANNDIVLTVPKGTDVTKLTASFSTTGERVRVGSKIQDSDNTVNDFSSPIVFTVDAGDGSWKNYTVKVSIEQQTPADIAAGITFIEAPDQHAVKLALPSVPDGYTITIKSSDRPDIISLDGTIIPPNADTTVTLVLEVTRTSDGTKASTISIPVAITAAKTVIATLTGSGSVIAGGSFDLTYGLANVTSRVYAQDFTFTYDPNQVEFVSAASVKAGFQLVGQSEKAGEIRFIAASLGPEMAVDTSGDLLLLHWRAKSASTSAAITVSKILISNGNGLETSVTGAYHPITILTNVDKAALDALIGNAQSVYHAAVEGTHIGQYPIGTKALLLAAINSAQAVSGNQNAAQQQVDQSVAALQAALQAFTASVIAPAPGDLNGDGKITIGDLAIVASCYGKTSADPNWNQYRIADMNNDGKIDIFDLAFIASKILSSN